MRVIIIAQNGGIKLSMELLHLHIIGLVSVLIIIIFFLFRNILKLRKVKKETLKEKRILQAILDSAGDGILVVDKHGSNIHYNNRFCKMWGIPREILDTNNNIEMINYVKNQLIDPK